MMGVAVSSDYGGSGLDHVSYAIAMAEISRGCASAGWFLYILSEVLYMQQYSRYIILYYIILHTYARIYIHTDIGTFATNSLI